MTRCERGKLLLQFWRKQQTWYYGFEDQQEVHESGRGVEKANTSETPARLHACQTNCLTSLVRACQTICPTSIYKPCQTNRLTMPALRTISPNVGPCQTICLTSIYKPCQTNRLTMFAFVPDVQFGPLSDDSSDKACVCLSHKSFDKLGKGLLDDLSDKHIRALSDESSDNACSHARCPFWDLVRRLV